MALTHTAKNEHNLEQKSLPVSCWQMDTDWQELMSLPSVIITQISEIR
jgi:hypothetical protein